jgi:hypothetical protein
MITAPCSDCGYGRSDVRGNRRGSDILQPVVEEPLLGMTG